MRKSVGIVGAGIIGRMIALELVDCGWEVTLFERDPIGHLSSCSMSAAGMLAATCELEQTEPVISRIGQKALQQWPAVLERLDDEVFFQQQGTLVVAHPEDQLDLIRFAEKILSKSNNTAAAQKVGPKQIRELEPDLPDRIQQGYFFAQEGQVDNRALLKALEKTLSARGVRWKFGTEVRFINAGGLLSKQESYTFDRVVDCRGLGARDQVKGLRGVRGELIVLEAPEVHLGRPIRLLHPRYPLYVVPRPHHRFLVGATAIESDDLKPLSVRSALELLSAAYSLHPGFAEGCIRELVTNCRPAFSNNLPRIMDDDGVVRVNGLYRHGFLLAPVLALWVRDYLDSGHVPMEATSLWQHYKHEHLC